MTKLMQSRTLTVAINARPVHIYRYISNPANLSAWAVSFVKRVAYQEYNWIVETVSGFATLRFVMPNTFGVLDHVITLESGLKIQNAMRVIANGAGSELVITVFQPDQLCSIQFDKYIKSAEEDLLNLKYVFETNMDARSK